MSKLQKSSREMMQVRTRLHHDSTSRRVGDKLDQLVTIQFPASQLMSCLVLCVDVENVLTEIDA
ncbi:hypothetical protein [Burkholderia gladioli]|uniref:hypothetical protein n=1 Tax=Burkholderia gladioli TaxID=28095 RepID=UPI0035C98A0F